MATTTVARSGLPLENQHGSKLSRGDCLAQGRGTDLGLRLVMLRITPLSAHPDRAELRVEGRLAGEASVELLREELERALRFERRVVLELSGVSFADREAVTLLASAAGRGVVLVGGSAWLTSLLDGAP